MEYYCHTSIGLVAIIPQPGLPTAVELFVAGVKCGAYLSADDAARAVSSSSTGHWRLDALPCSGVPALLSDWKQSLPLSIITGTLPDELPEPQPPDAQFQQDPESESEFAFDCGK